MTAAFTPADRTMRARQAAHASWAQTDDRTARTSKARAAFAARFEREVDPLGELAPSDRARRAEAARKAFYAGLALKSARARRHRTTDTTAAASARLEGK